MAVDKIDVLTKKVERLTRLVEDMTKTSKKETWVKACYIMEFTIWSDKEKMRQARQQGIVKWRKTEANGFQYLLESINPMFLKQKQVA